ncbi:type VI secretion system Vgr family protein [Luteimonas sp. FCS-9]|uniref:type VI secretion system Vgr family protein n=1 Tax=Luteimonas sp. FCS-9 TaxID=1547516 RepID=UPI00063E79D0|nr:type VI secretion system Vgr family protein [Luteimonas sp. FCS-9]KLJ00611.1 type IV secretion protein Rhs [Luteimonas sp. FCS-9]
MEVPTGRLTALLAGPGQTDRLMRLHTPLGPDVLVAEALSGYERLDAGYRLDVTALSVDARLDLHSLLGRPVLLALQAADPLPRWFHGHVTAFECVGSNGGLARYRLVVEPWLAFLGRRIDSYVFQDMRIPDIVEDVFADYAGAGPLAPAWRWDLADRDAYPVRSLTTQYAESDLAFVRRLLADAGIFCWFEHDGDPASETFGRHTLVLADHNAAFADLGAVRYHRSDATERDDAIQHWSDARRLQTARLSRASWDYRSLALRPASLEGATHGQVAPADVDTAGPYAWPDAAAGERHLARQLEALQVDARRIEGRGSWRRLAPGAHFSLTGHFAAAHETDGFVCIGVEHGARNNLGAEVFDVVERRLGAWLQAPLEPPSALAGLEAAPAPASLGEVAFYRNRFDAIPALVPYRPRTVDGHGLRLHARPTVHGTQSAIVVGDGGPVLTDRDHRIKVQFPWQRGSDASSGQAHPGGDDNAPGHGGAWTWVRVATPWAGDDWGGVAIPRCGQEVLVAFLEGDIDRPVVVGALYNGRGQDDAAHNRVPTGGAGATGNAPAWFAGNDHGAVFTGFKSQAMAQSQDGSGGYQMLRLDDTPGQGRAQLATTQHAATLTLGHLREGEDNRREATRGFGAELSTRASGAVRAGAGLLLTTEPGRLQLAAPGLQTQLAEGEQLLQTLADTAAQQQAALPGDRDTLPAQDSLRSVQKTLGATAQGKPVDGIGGGAGEVPAWGAPLLAASSPDGLLSLTPADQVWVSGTQTALLAGDALGWTSQGGLVAAAAGGIALFAQGGEPPAGSPNPERGIALHAAQGKLSARAPRNKATVAAKTNVAIASTQADVEIVAPAGHVLLTAVGAYLKLEGGNIELGAPGRVEFRASSKDWVGAQGEGASERLSVAEYKGCAEKVKSAAATGGARVEA